MLEIKNLWISYGKDIILKGMDLEVSDSETLAIIGESGTGKTSLGLSIMRIAEAEIKGKISFQGKDILEIPEKEMQQLRWNRISMVFQNVNNVLNPVYTVLDQVAEPMIEHGFKEKSEAYSRARELLDRFGLSEKRYPAYPHQLSGGEQQRVLLAMALANDPNLLILDEPLSSLDAVSRTEIGELLKQDNGNRTKLVVTHDLDTAGKLADRIAVLYGGRIVEIGKAGDVLRFPRHPYTRALIRAYPNMTTVKDLQGIKGRMTRSVSGCPFHPRCTQMIDICRDRVPHFTWNNGRGVSCHRGGIATLLSVENISKSFGSIEAVKSVSLSIEAGETLALVGQSGSGKTTLAKTIMCLYQASGGNISFDNVNIQCSEKNLYKKIQMIFQNPGESLSHRLSALDSVTEPLDIQGIGTKEERKNKAIQTLNEVELPNTEDFLHKYPHHLSGGEIQRIAIARALILDPMLIIADEPTAFLDASTGAKILKLLLNLQEQRGLSMLYITHDIAIARKVSDRIAIMLDGRIVEQGFSSEILANPKEIYTRKLLDSGSSLHQLEANIRSSNQLEFI